MKRMTISAIVICLLVGLLLLAVYTPARSTGGPPASATAPVSKSALIKDAVGVPPASSAQAAKAEDPGWPRTYATPSGAYVTIYQPQVASWDNQQRLVAYAAVAYLATGTRTPALGTLKVEADTSVSGEHRLVSFSPLKITEANFQNLPKEQVNEITSQVEKSIPPDDRVIALDRVLSYIDKSQIIPKNVEGIKTDPPVIYSGTSPSLLVNIDGNTIWSPIKGNDLKFAVNTNWDLFLYGPTNSYYLRNEDSWLTASDLKGTWSPAGKLPASFSQLPNDENWKDVRANLPGKPSAQAPVVYVSTAPAELILMQGQPQYSPVSGTSLLWVKNTESDLFRLNANGPFYYLVAGRWFTAPNLKGPWQFASTSLPGDFKSIPMEHPRSRVLASVPGTQQAAEAVLLAQVPQTARVNKKELKAPEVVYQGQPQYEPIEGTQLQRAVNTDKDIIKVGDLYYMCVDGVWFEGTSPEGPWQVTDSVPGQIYEIPVSSPSHNVTYVTEEDEQAGDDWVTFETYPGYDGMMTAWGCAVWGTGWYYPPYVWWGGYYPVYYPYWRTFGCAAWYNPYTGHYGTGGRVYGPYGGAGFGARYNPKTGTYARGSVAYGPTGARGAAQAYNPRTGTYAGTRQGGGVYGSWGSTSVQRGNEWASTQRATNRVTGNTTRVTRTDEGAMVSRRGQGGSGFVAAGQDNVYAGKDGNVYRRDENGNWSKYENGRWDGVQRPDGVGADPKIDSGNRAGRTPTLRAEGDNPRPPSGDDRSRNRDAQIGAGAGPMDSSTFTQLERDRSARTEGAQRTRDFNNYQNRGGGNAGSYRGGGVGGGGFGGRRGGGGFGGGRR